MLSPLHKTLLEAFVGPGFPTFQLEEETKKSIEAQRRHQEETLAAAAAEAARMTELAAAASARAAAADAVKEAVAAAEQDEFKRKAQKLKVRYSRERWRCCFLLGISLVDTYYLGLAPGSNENPKDSHALQSSVL